MNLDLIAVPYDSGKRDERMGRGPGHLLGSGLPAVLGDRGHAVRPEIVEVDLEETTESAVAFAVAGVLAGRVRRSREAGRFPLVLAGNCMSALGTVAGLGAPETGVVWFDAHGDFNTPETSPSGFLDGMALAAVAGRCWREATATVPGFEPLPENAMILVGARDLDPGEVRLLARSGVRRIPPERLRDRGVAASLAPALDALGDRVRNAYVHVDLDVLDPEEARANTFAAPGGLRLDELLASIEMIGERCRVRAGALTAYDPEVDVDDAALRAGFRVAARLAAAAKGSEE